MIDKNEEILKEVSVCWNQAHEKPVRSARFTRNGEYVISGDDAGIIKYWKPNLELVKVPASSLPFITFLGCLLADPLLANSPRVASHSGKHMLVVNSNIHTSRSENFPGIQ